MVSNTFAKSLGYGGSAKIQAKSIINGGGCYDPASKASKASNGELGAAKPIHKTTYQNRPVTPGAAAKGHGGSISKAKTIADPQESAKQTKGQSNAKR